MRTAAHLELPILPDGIERECAARPEGHVTHVVGLTIESIGPHISIGDLAWIERTSGEGGERIPVQLVGFRDRLVQLMPFERLGGIRPGARVVPGGPLRIRAGYSLLGRVLDGLARPIDHKPEPKDTVEANIDAEATPPLLRERLSSVFTTGVRAIDGLLTCAKGQRLGIFSGSGVGKSVLLGSLARNSCATVNVIGLIGERGREVRDFIETCLGEGMKKSVVVVATPDESPLMRMKAASTTMAIAEFFRDQGEDVLLLMDSLTRYGMAQREIGLASGEPPTTKGYPPSVFGLLANLLERSGTSAKGSITAFYTVLVEADDMNDPIADSVRSILDGHIVLSRELAEANHYPAVDVLMSVSRVMGDVVSAKHRENAGRLRSLLSVYRNAQDLVNVGAYVPGSNPRIDESLDKIESINRFLCQSHDERVSWETMIELLEKVVA